ncbi:MAG: PAS domain S-box protein [Syntrophales bacterium]|nr:PAS domain S-box protein [Syntrophales bacterium]
MAQPLRILILEDNPVDSELIQFELEEAGLVFTSKVAMTEEDFICGLQEFSPDLILSDYDLPRYNGALALAEARRRCPDTPFILVTGAVTEDRAIDILTQGAKDYVLKNRLQQRLAPAVRRALAEAEALRARERAEAELREAHRTLEMQVVERTEALRKTEGRYRSLFDNMLEGFAYCRMIFDLGHPADFVYLDVNRSFETLTGLSDVVGKRVTEVIPGIRESDGDLFETYGRVALTGEPERFVRYVAAMEMWFSVSVYSPEKESFVAVFDVITQRKRIEEELRESEGLFHTLADSIPNLAWWAGRDGYLTWYNRRWYEYTGTTPEQMEGWGWQSVHDPQVLPQVLERWRGSIATGQPFEMDFPLRGADGVFRPFLTRVLPLKDSSGQVLRWFGTNTNISPLKEAENALREIGERQRLVLQASSMGTFEFDLLTGEGQWNATEFELLGLRPGDVPAGPESFFRFVHPDDLGPLRDAWEVALRTGKLDAEFRILRADGRERWLAGKGHFFFDGESGGDDTGTSGKPLRFMGVNFDITDRRKAEDEARKERERLAALINSIQDEIWFADTGKRFTLANPAALKEFHLDPDNGPNVEDLAASLEVYRPDGTIRPVAEAPALRALQGEVVRNQEEIIRTPASGALRYRQVSSSPVRDESGSIIGSVSVVRDITEGKRMEEALRKSREGYHDLVESSGSVILRVDREMRITFMNRYGLQLFGYSEDEVIGRKALGTIVPREDEQGRDIAGMAQDIIEHPEKYPTNVHQNMCKDGRLVWMSWTNRAIYDDRGDLVGLFSIGNELTKTDPFA